MTLAPLEKNIVATETLRLEANAHELMVHEAEDADGDLTPELRQRLLESAKGRGAAAPTVEEHGAIRAATGSVLRVFLESRADFANGVKGISREEVLARLRSHHG